MRAECSCSIPLKMETDNEINTWIPFGLLHTRQKAAACNDAYCHCRRVHQLHRSHRVQLLLYGYLIAQNFNVDNLVLICVLVPRRHSKWLDKLTPVKWQKFVKTISTKAETLITSQPSRKNRHSLGAIVHRDIRVNLQVFKYDQ